MRQYRELKRRAGDALLFFRMGDFYELFDADAERAAPLLDLVLTSRDRDTPQPVPMCGVPFHALEGYVRRCLAAGLSVAIAEQTEDPRTAKGLVRREITEVVTPGLVANADRLEGAGANYVAAVLSDQGRHGIAYLDLSTGEFAATETDRRELFEAELDRIGAREIVARDAEKDLPAGVQIRRVGDRDFEPRAVAERVGALPHGLGADERSVDARAAAALVATVAELQPAALAQLGALRRYRASDLLLLDRATRRHLELFQNLRDGGSDGTLFAALDLTRTPLGRRRLAAWLGEPLIAPGAIRARHDRVEAWLEPDSRREALREALRGVGDLERAATRALLPTGGPRELAQLRAWLHGVARTAKVTPLGDALESLARRARARARRRPAGRAARRAAHRLHPRRRRRRARPDPPGLGRGRGLLREPGGARARAHGHPGAQGPLQPRVRLVDRGQQGAARARARRLPAQADHRGRRALHDRRARALGERRPCAGASARRPPKRACSRSSARACAPRPAGSARPRPRSRSSTRPQSLAQVARERELGAARGRRLSRARDRGRPAPRGRAHRARRLRPERPGARRRPRSAS